LFSSRTVNLNLKKNAPKLIAAIVLLVVFLVQFASHHWPSFDLVEFQERLTYDWRVRQSLKFDRPVAQNLGFVVIDDASIKEMNQRHGFSYPFPRQIYGQLIKELSAQGAKTIGFDILLSELHASNNATAIKLPGGELIQSDAYFAEQLRRHTNAILAAGDGLLPAMVFRTNAWAIGDISPAFDADGILRRIKPFTYYTNWNEVLETIARVNDWDLTASRVERDGIHILNSKGEPVLDDDKKPFIVLLDAQGNFNITNYVDGEFSKAEQLQKAIPSVVRIWHLGLILAARELALDLEKATILPDRIIIPGANGANRVIPLNRKGSIDINWSVPLNDERLFRMPLEKVIDAGLERAKGSNIPPVWKDKLVVVGSTGAGNNIADVGATPFDRHTYLISKHWNVANSIITNSLVYRTHYALEFLLILILGISGAVLSWRLGPPWGTLCIAGISLIYLGIALFLYVQYRFWLTIVLPVGGGLLLGHAAQVSYQVIFEQREKRRVKGVFAKVVSPHIVNELLALDDLKLGGSRKNITVFFADVRGFTQLTDAAQRRAEEYIKENGLAGLEAEAYRDEVARETLATVNTYLATIADQIKKHEGTLDKYIGDCVMAFWGAPIANERHAESCVLSSIAAQRAMYELNQTRLEENKRRTEENMLRQASGLTPLEMLALLSLGTGINSGIVTVGMMGSKDAILNYTVFGGPVNLASRLEGLSGRGRIIIGEATFAELQRTSPELAATIVELPPAMVKGISEPVRNWEVPWRLDKDKTSVTPAGPKIKPIEADSTAFIPKAKPADADSTAFIPKEKKDETKS
jgi:class 3 adenylate cyclase/CHASE2 domain-containing sensor protein